MRALSTLACLLAATLFPCPSSAASFTYESGFRPVALTPGKDGLFASDYRFIYHIAESGELRVLNISGIRNPKYRYLSDINPAGLFYRDGLLYVANYQNRNLLVLRYDGTALHLLSTIEHPRFVSPEGVYVTDRYLGVADYDASKIFVFDRRTQRLLLEKPLPLAHGIAIQGKEIFATGLGGISLVRFNIATGSEIRSPTRMLYPTVLQLGPGGALYAIDAHTGTLTAFNRNLEKQQEIPFGIGKGENHTLRPYGFAFYNGKLYIADTYKHRIARYENGQLHTITAIAPILEIGSPAPVTIDENNCLHGHRPEPYEELAAFLTGTPGKTTLCVQGVIVTSPQAKTFVALPVPGPRPLNLVWALESGPGIFLFGDPASSYLLRMDTRAGTCRTIPLPGSLALYAPETATEKTVVTTLALALPSTPIECKPPAMWTIR